MKDQTNKNATSIIILQGYVVHVGKVTKIICPTAGEFCISWKGDYVPSGLKQGKYITVTGRLISFMLGRSAMVVRGELLQAKSLNEIKKFIRERGTQCQG